MKKTIVIIGAGKGLSSGIAEKFGSNNFRVILMARSEAHLKEYADAFTAKGIEVYTKAADVADLGVFTKSFEEVLAAYGTPDVVFYNVGVTAADADCEINAQTMLDRYKVDVIGAYQTIQLLDTDAFARNNGTILITGGGLGIQPYYGYLPLSMDKAALRAMVQAAAPVLKEKGIHLATVQVTGVIGSNEHYAPKAIAEEFWKLYNDREKTEIIY